jgi:hypothetical protein
MALEYRLTFAGDTPVELMAARALPDPDERPTGIPPILSADLFDRYGLQVTVRGGHHGYVDALSDQGEWEWEPETYVAVGFRLDKFADREELVTNMVTIARQALTTGPEDAAFVFNGDVLLFTRFGGEVVKHNRDSWWAYHPAADQLISG